MDAAAVKQGEEVRRASDGYAARAAERARVREAYQLSRCVEEVAHAIDMRIREGERQGFVATSEECRTYLRYLVEDDGKPKQAAFDDAVFAGVQAKVGAWPAAGGAHVAVARDTTRPVLTVKWSLRK